MKKFTKTVSTLLFGLIFLSTMSVHAIEPVSTWATIKIIAEAVGAIAGAYAALPNADYYIEYCVDGNCQESEHVGRCDIARKMKDKAFERGATEVTIYSVQLTAHGDCNNKTYKR